MARALKPIRRVVTGDDENGKSRVVWDGPAPAMHEASMGSGRGHIDFWDGYAQASGNANDSYFARSKEVWFFAISK